MIVQVHRVFSHKYSEDSENLCVMHMWRIDPILHKKHLYAIPCEINMSVLLII